MVVFTEVVFVFRSKIIMQFLSNQDAYDIAYYALVIQCASQVAVPFSVCANMLFQSIGKAGRATILATFRSGSIYIPVLLILGTLFWTTGNSVDTAGYGYSGICHINANCCCVFT